MRSLSDNPYMNRTTRVRPMRSLSDNPYESDNQDANSNKKGCIKTREFYSGSDTAPFAFFIRFR